MTPLLTSKLTPPRIFNTVERKRLYPLMDAISTNFLTTVIAGAGFGKTTFVAQTVARLKTDTVWYRLDHSDRDFSTFITYLVFAISNYYPVGERTFQRMREATVLQWEREAILTTLLGELECAVTNELLIVFDDFHCASESVEVRDVLGFFLMQKPRNLHFVIISRADPGLSLSLLRAGRSILEIDEADLSFTVEETGQLFDSLFSVALSEPSLRVIQQRTGGWIAGLILANHSLKGKSSNEITEFLTRLKGSQRYIANYLEENVYDIQPPAVKEFLRKTSILSRMNARFCDSLLGIECSSNILETLEQRHLFTRAIDDTGNWYAYHHLFQEFLKNRLKDLDRAQISKLHRASALLWEELGEEEEAMPHWFAAGDISSACRLFSQMGRRKLIEEGRLKLICSYLEKIPSEYIVQNPWIQYMQARVWELQCKVDDACRGYAAAREAFLDHGLKHEARLCLKGQAYCNFVIGDFRTAEAELEELLPQLNDVPYLRAEILATMISIASHLGHTERAEEYFNEVENWVRRKNAIPLLGWLYLNQGLSCGTRGDFEKSLDYSEKAIESFRERGVYHLLCTVYHTCAWACYYLGRFEQGLEYASNGLALTRTHGINNSSEGWLLMDLALNCLGLGQLEDAQRSGEEALTYFSAIDCRWGRAYTSHVLQQIYFALGDRRRAEQAVLSGLASVSPLDLPLDEGLLEAGLAAQYLEEKMPKLATPLLESAERKLGETQHVLRVYLSQARCYRQLDNESAAAKKLLTGLRLCREHRHDLWITWEEKWIVPALLDLQSQGEMKDYISTLLKTMTAHHQRGSLRIVCLGRFRVLKGAQEIPSSAWRSKKSKQLLKILVQSRSRGWIAKDELLEILWPEGDPQITTNRLNVALSTLRKILQHERDDTPYIVRDGESYRLDLGPEDWVDTDWFREHVRDAKSQQDPQAALEHCQKAFALYSGDYMEEDRYLDWFVAERESAKEDYLYVLKTLSSWYEQKNDYDKCIQYTKRYLATDAYAEEQYRRLMTFYARLGTKSMVVKTYNNCREKIREGYDSDLSQETKSLYEELLSPVT